MIRSAISPRLAMRIFLNTGRGGRGYAARRIAKSFSPYSTGCPFLG